jgi:hypothetical protein
MRPARIEISRSPGRHCGASLKFSFDPKVIGPERTAKIWEGVGQILANILERNEYPRALAQLEKARRDIDTDKRTSHPDPQPASIQQLKEEIK